MERSPHLLNNGESTLSHAGTILSIAPRSLAARLGLRPGDEVLAVNGHPVEDVIDVQFYAADDEVEIVYRRDGHQPSAISHRQSGQPLGIEFSHPTFDIDIRRCNNRCPFCFVLQTAPRMRRTLYIKDDDYRYSFLYGHFVTLTNLSERDWQRIEEQHLSPLYVSVHATDLETRRKCLANPNAPDIVEQLRWLAERRIEVHTQLVITPGLNDGPHIDESVRDLATLYPSVRSVSVVPVGLTKHHKYGHRPLTREEMEEIIAQVGGWQAEYLQRFGVRFVYLTDEWYLATGREVPPKEAYDGLELQENGLGQVRDFLEDWARVSAEIQNPNSQKPKGRRDRRAGRSRRRVGDSQTAIPNSPFASRHATLATATLFAPTLRKTAAHFNRISGSTLQVIPIINERLGETITVAGLLMGHDITRQLEGHALGEFVVLPRVMFDHPQGISLDDVSPLEIAKKLGKPVYLADALGDVLDAFTGVNLLRFDPAAR